MAGAVFVDYTEMQILLEKDSATEAVCPLKDVNFAYPTKRLNTTFAYRFGMGYVVFM